VGFCSAESECEDKWWIKLNKITLYFSNKRRVEVFAITYCISLTFLGTEMRLGKSMRAFLF